MFIFTRTQDKYVTEIAQFIKKNPGCSQAQLTEFIAKCIAEIKQTLASTMHALSVGTEKK